MRLFSRKPIDCVPAQLTSEEPRSAGYCDEIIPIPRGRQTLTGCGESVKANVVTTGTVTSFRETGLARIIHAATLARRASEGREGTYPRLRVGLVSDSAIGIPGP